MSPFSESDASSHIAFQGERKPKLNAFKSDPKNY